MKKRKTAVFTLVECLVVISVIAILAALLLPALQKARVKGEAVPCAGNLRQIGMAVMQYAGDHDDIVVPIDYDSNLWGWPAALMGTEVKTVTKGNYCSIANFRCVSVKTPVDMTGTVTAGDNWQKAGWWISTPHYGMNWQGIGRRPVGSAMSGQKVIKFAQVKQPSLKSFICDTARMKAANGVKEPEIGFRRWNPYHTGGSWPSGFSSWGLPVARHGGTVNILHCDGSVSSAGLLVEDSCSVDPFRANTTHTDYRQ